MVIFLLPGVQADNYTYSSEWTIPAEERLHAPSGIANDHSGNVYVSDPYYNRIWKYTPDGTFLKKWGSTGASDGQFNHPSGIAVDGQDNIYVVDTGNSRIQKFSSDGSFLLNWNSSSLDDGDFSPHGIVTDHQDNVFITDPHNERILKFSPNGSTVAHWSSSMYPRPPFSSEWVLSGITVDSANMIVFPDIGNDCIRFLHANGSLEREWLPYDTHDKLIGSVVLDSAITEDTKGNILFVDNWHNRILEYNTSIGLIRTFGEPGTGDGQLLGSQGISVDKDGNVYVADTGNERIVKFSPSGTYLTDWGLSGKQDLQFYHPQGVAIGQDNGIYIADTGNDRIMKFSPSGTFIAKWGTTGTGQQQFRGPLAVTTDKNGDVYVADTGNDRIQKFTSSGSFISAWGSTGGADGQFRSPRDIAASDEGTVYVADAENHRIQVFDTSGKFLTKWDLNGMTFNGEFITPASVVLNAKGEVFVADTGAHRIQKFTSSGGYITKWNIPDLSSHIAVGENDTFYIPDPRTKRIIRYNSSGGDLVPVDTEGIGQFIDPRGFAIDNDNNLYVADTGDSRIAKYSLSLSSGIGNITSPLVPSSDAPPVNNLTTRPVHENRFKTLWQDFIRPLSDTMQKISLSNLQGGGGITDTPPPVYLSPGVPHVRPPPSLTTQEGDLPSIEGLPGIPSGIFRSHLHRLPVSGSPRYGSLPVYLHSPMFL